MKLLSFAPFLVAVGARTSHAQPHLLEAMTVSILSSSRRHAPFGMAGGQDGERGRNWVERADGTRVEMTGTDRCDVRAGDVFVVESPGGGGYGEPVAMKEAAA